MPKIQADFSSVKSGFSTLPTDDYRCKIEAVEFDATARNPFHTITLVVDDPEHVDFNNQKLWDRIYMNKKDGSVNPMSLGKIKQYAEAILGEDEANGDNIDTDDFVDSYVIATVEVEPWTNEEKGTSGESNRVKRVSAAE
jgi:hypothetical protein